MPWRILLPCLLLAIGAGWVAIAPQRVADSSVPSMATFNIENFPRDDTQPEAAARAIGALRVPLVAVQEIRRPARFALAVRETLGPHWVYVSYRGTGHTVGLLVDTRAFRVVGGKRHDEVKVTKGGRPALEVEVVHRGGTAKQSIFVVHLKSGPGKEAIRQAQLKALARIVVQRDEPVTVLGDFNPVSDADRRALHHFAMVTGLSWNSRSLDCTAYFSRGGRCRGVALDHVMSTAFGRVVARGPCETVGCDPGEHCPVDAVSDHCPVVFNPRRLRRLPTGE